MHVIVLAVAQVLELERLGTDAHVHQVIQVNDSAVSVGGDIGHTRTGHRLEHAGKDGIAGDLALGGEVPEEIRHVQERAAAGTAAHGEHHVDLSDRVQELVLVVVDNPGVGDGIQDIVDFLADVDIVDDEGDAAVGAELTGAGRHIRQTGKVLLRHPGEPVLVHIIDLPRLLDEDLELLAGGEGYLLAGLQLQGPLVLTVIGVDTDETDHRRDFTIGVDKHLLRVEDGLHAGSSETDV